MTRDLKRRLVAELIPAVVVPVTRVGVDYYFNRQLMETSHEHEIEMAERRGDAFAAIGGEPVRNTTPSNGSRPRSPQVYEGLEDIRRSTDCGFCRHAAGQLKQQDRETAAKGLDELQQYHEYLDEARTNQYTRERVEGDIESIVDGWEVVPRVVGGSNGQGP